MADSLPLQAIAAAGVGEDGVGVRDDLTPTGLALPWFDRRAATQANDLQRTSRYAAQAGIAIDYSRTAAKWLWLRQNRPADLLSSAFWVALHRLPGSCVDRSRLHERDTRCSNCLLRCVCTPLDRTSVDGCRRSDAAARGRGRHSLGPCSEGSAARERSRVNGNDSDSRWTRSSDRRRYDPAVTSRRSGGLDGNSQPGLRRDDRGRPNRG